MKHSVGFFGVVCAVMLAVAMMIGVSGCDKGDKVDLAAVDAPIRALLDRHDKYVKADASLAQIDKDIAVRTSDLIRKTLDTAHKKVAPKPSADAKIMSLDAEALTQGTYNDQFIAVDAVSKAKYTFVNSTFIKETVCEPSYKIKAVSPVYSLVEQKCSTCPGADKSECKKQCISTHELASQGLFFESEAAMRLYLKSENRKQVGTADVKYYGVTTPTIDDLKAGNEAGERLYDKYANKL